MPNQIHPSAIVSTSAELGNNNQVGPFAVIEDGVRIGDDNVIAAHAVIKTGTGMANRNQVFEQAVIGGMPQHTRFSVESEPTFVEIGSENVFREAVTVNRSYLQGKSTILGNGNYLMYSAHIGHDCEIGDNNTFVTSCGIGGHVSVANRAFISGGVMVHQFVHIGSYAMIGGNSKITQDVLPFMMTDGNPAAVRGLNLVGLKRAGFVMEDIRALKQAYRLLFRREMSLEANLAEMQAVNHPLVTQLCRFVEAAERGFHRPE